MSSEKTDTAQNWGQMIRKNYQNDDEASNGHQPNTQREGKKKGSDKKGGGSNSMKKRNDNDSAIPSTRRNNNSASTGNSSRSDPNHTRQSNNNIINNNNNNNNNNNSHHHHQTAPNQGTAAKKPVGSQPSGGFIPPKHLSSNSPSFMPQQPSASQPQQHPAASAAPTPPAAHTNTNNHSSTSKSNGHAGPANAKPPNSEAIPEKQVQKHPAPTSSSTANTGHSNSAAPVANGTAATVHAPENSTPPASAPSNPNILAPSVLKKDVKRTQSAPLSDQPNKPPLNVPAKSKGGQLPQYHPTYQPQGQTGFYQYPPYWGPVMYTMPVTAQQTQKPPTATVQPKKKSVIAIIDPESKEEIKVNKSQIDNKKDTPSFLLVETPNKDSEKKKKEEEERKRKQQEEEEERKRKQEEEEEERKRKEEEERKRKQQQQEEEERKRKEEEERKRKQQEEEEERKKKEEEQRRKKEQEEEEERKKREKEEELEEKRKESNTGKEEKSSTEFLKYPKGTWTPLDQNGSKHYPLDFLLSFEEFAHCKAAPENLTQPKAQNATYRQSVSKSYNKNRKQQNKSKKRKPEVPNQAENPWRPNRFPVNEADMKTRAIRTILNKMTPSNEYELFQKIKTLDLGKLETMNNLIELLFDKAVREHKYCKMYSSFCVRIFHLGYEYGTDPHNAEVKVNFKRLLLKKCQTKFEDFFVQRTPIQFSNLLSEEEKEFKLTQMKFGIVIFMAELFSAKLLAPQVIHLCIQILLGSEASTLHPGNDSIEAACILLTSVGKKLDNPTAQNKMTDYFNRFEEIIKTTIPLRIKFTIQNLIDLRHNDWVDTSFASQMKKQVELEAEKQEPENKSQDARGTESKSDKKTLPPKIESSFKGALEEFFNSFEVEDLKEELEEMDVAVYHSDFIYLALIQALQNSKYAGALKKEFLPEFVSSSLLKREDFIKAFDRVLKELRSISEDNPKAQELFFELAGAAILDTLLPITHIATWGDDNLIKAFKAAASFKSFYTLKDVITKQKWEIPKGIKSSKGLEALSLEETFGNKIEGLISKGDSEGLIQWKSSMLPDMAVEFFVVNKLLLQGVKESNFARFVKPFLDAIKPVDRGHPELTFISYIAKFAAKNSFIDENSLSDFFSLLLERNLIKPQAFLSWKKKEADNPILKHLDEFFKNLK